MRLPGVKSFQEKTGNGCPLVVGQSGLEQNTKLRAELDREETKPAPAGVRFPAPTGDQILQERGWKSCCVKDDRAQPRHAEA